MFFNKFLLIAVYLVVVVYGIPSSLDGCDHLNSDNYWAYTTGYGVYDYATAGVVPGGPNLCVAYNRSAEEFFVQYHVLWDESFKKEAKVAKKITAGNSNNCLNKDQRIYHCEAYCSNSTLQSIATKNALLYYTATGTSRAIFKDLSSPSNWVVNVISMDLKHSPPAYIEQDIFIDNNYCSVNVGIKTNLVTYLVEVQIVKLIG